MKLYPAIDLYGGKAVRLLRGDYAQMTVYDENPAALAHKFHECGAENLHLVDLEGARSGGTPNIDRIREIVRETKLFCEVGGGIRSPVFVDYAPQQEIAVPEAEAFRVG